LKSGAAPSHGGLKLRPICGLQLCFRTDSADHVLRLKIHVHRITKKTHRVEDGGESFCDCLTSTGVVMTNKFLLNISLLKECLLRNSLLSLLSGGRSLLLLAQKEALTITTCMQLRPAWLQFNFCAQYLLSQVLNFLFRRTVSATRFCYFIYLE